MKKNITINLFGALYNIDEDAYELLNRYLKDMKRYFSNHDGGEEIADDIEHRVAELLSELKYSGVDAITIEHVEDIIRRIGNPEQFEDTGENDETVSNKEKEVKKLFRNPEDKKVAGVMSGMACYWGMDTLALRIIAILIIFLTQGVGLLVYLFMWLIIPEAKTPEDMLRMHGKPVNIENLREQILNGAGRMQEFVCSPKTESKASGCLSAILDLFVNIFKFLILMFLGGTSLLFILGFLFVLFCMGVMLYASIAGFSSLYYYNADSIFLQTMDILPSTAHWGFWISSISLLVVLAVPVYAFILWIGRTLGKTTGITSKVRTTLILIWISALVLFGVFTTTTFMTVSKIYLEEYNKNFSINGFQIPEWQYNILKKENWNILEHKNCSNQYVSWREGYKDQMQYYLHSENKDGIMQYHLEKSEKVSPGVYRLEAVGRSNGTGAFIYAKQGKSLIKKEIPVYSNENGTIWEEAQQQISSGNLSYADSIYLHDICKSNNGKGYGWSRVCIDSIVVKQPGELYYGVSNVPSFTGKRWNGTWLSAAEFILTRL